jgi:exodeoxyribonuclease VII large subunit
MPNEKTFVTVSQVNGYIKEIFDGVAAFRGLTVKGEISNFKRYSNAAYFDLKDDKSVLSCVIWNDSLIYLRFEPKDGDEVLATGNVQVYQPRGRYQLYVSRIELFGQGAELLKLEALKKKLQAEGLFNEERKRPIPSFPASVGLIVGDGSAAEADLLKNLQRRWPLADIIVFPSLVQGANAPKDLLRAYKLSQQYPLSTLILARGGGSSEDLSAFNDEALVRAVASSRIPTISAVGHEVDFTLLDYVVDKRVSTPTGAAEAATPDQADIRMGLDESQQSLDNAFRNRIDSYREKLKSLAGRPFFVNPQSIYQEALDEVDELNQRLDLAMGHALEIRQERLKASKAHLEALNPYGVLQRGYSITEKEDGTIVKSTSSVKVGETIKSHVKDGIITSTVK